MILDMLVRRKDHACALVKIDEETGLLVSGGVDGEDNLLDSVEFYNLETQEWEELSPLKKARTEHGKYNFIFLLGFWPNCMPTRFSANRATLILK